MKSDSDDECESRAYIERKSKADTFEPVHLVDAGIEQGCKLKTREKTPQMMNMERAGTRRETFRQGHDGLTAH